MLEAPLSDARLQQLEAARQLKKWPLAKLVSLFESRLASDQQQRHQVVQHLMAYPALYPAKARILGFTGTPGAGKSSLIAALCDHLLTDYPETTVAVLAVDPSSQSSGGAILGDRTRMTSGSVSKNLYFRSQASNLELGGVAHATFQAVRLLRHFFDLIFVETVGIGQNEIDIQQVADETFLIMQPLAGDQIQFMKSGIMEIPDSFVVNKCDEEKLARSSYYMLRAALKQARIVALDETDDHTKSTRDNIFLTSAHTHKGVAELAQHILQHQNSETTSQEISSWSHREKFYLEKEIEQRFGSFGLELWRSKPDLTEATDSTYEQQRQSVVELIEGHILS